MFHAVIRTDRDALHLIGNLDAYGLVTLQQHVRSARHEHAAVRLQFAGPPAVHSLLSRRFRRWLRRLTRAGIIVEVVCG